MLFENLEALMVPPLHAQEVPVGELATFEQEQGVRLPADYGRFICRYGSGCIDDFLWVFNPASGNMNLSLSAQAGQQLAALREAGAEVHHLPFSLNGERPELLPFGITDNGDCLLWHTAGSPASWPVVVIDSRLSEYAVYPLCLVEFLYRVLSRGLRVDLFPADFPSENPKFRPIA